jgi:hypothetical protein
MGIGERLMHAWNAFTNVDQFRISSEAGQITSSAGVRPDRHRLFITNERTIISSIYTRLAIDVASVSVRHVRTDDEGRYLEDIPSGLNNCLTVEANLDQAARQFRMDVAMTLFDAGVVAIVPVDTTLNPLTDGGYDVKTMRVGTVSQWYPRSVKVNLYNEKTGQRQDITLDKSIVAIVENPLYSVMNETNSTLRRLIRKLNLLDSVDEASSSGKLDLIIQLPYVIKSEARRLQAEQRRKDIEFQLKGSKYGIAYTDGTEKVIQLNRPAENSLMSQVEYLTELLYAQLGLTKEVMNGTADEKAMLNYHNRTIEPIISAIFEEMRRKFLTKTARTQGQSIEFFKDPFKFVPLSDFAEIVDKLTRNEVMSSNEIRQVVGLKPSNDPKADQLVNSNMPQDLSGAAPSAEDPQATADMNAAFDSANATLDGLFNSLGVSENANA